MTTRRNDEALWRALQEQHAMDVLEEIEAMSPEELDADIRANGGDPDAIAKAGIAHVERLMAARAKKTPTPGT